MKLMKSLLVIATLSVFAVSCASKKKSEDVGGAEGQALDSSISSQGIAYDQMGSDSGNISGLNSVNFDYDSATLSTEARKTLADNAEWIRSHGDVTIQIEGHCDSRGSVEYNLALGERRAKAVKSYLASLGIDSKRMTIISYGEEKPIALGDSESDYAKNRRANFVPLQ
ncbi:MAG TPA: peptidoglycan-associated lipoprotein Pal [Bdellovibrionales bacterium]|nr:peptidoglycan-associated lipoprotein [Pseudobdellovibrionaceae bacterium]HAG92195.1 peptidoglycan-associated lipoprotein Pal [Bdellovibrionales bacterium]|tara:strand:- start:3975 stop:4481 length:507 start_codon:yes stop_codon:yes gene_type:complete